MRNFAIFLKAVAHHWIILLTGGFMIAAVFIAQALIPVPAWVFLVITVLTLVLAFYKAWQDQQKLVSARDLKISELEGRLDERARRRELIDALSEELKKGRKMLEEAENYSINLENLISVSDWWFSAVQDILKTQLSLADANYFATDDRHKKDVDESNLPLELERQKICRGAQVRILNLSDIIERLQNQT